MPTSNNNDNNSLPLENCDHAKILELSPDAIFIHIDGIIKYVNPSALKLFGLENQSELIGKSIWNIYPTDSHGLIRTRIQQVLDTHQSAPFIELKINRANGSFVTVLCANIPINFDTHPAVFVIMRDISARKTHEVLINMQYSIASNLITNPSLENAIALSIKMIHATIQADLIRVWTLDNSTNMLNCMTAWTAPNLLSKMDINHTLKPQAIEANQGIIGKTIQKLKSYYYDNDSDEDQDLGYSTTITLPLTANSSAIGVLELKFVRSFANDPIILNTLTECSNLIGSYIKRKIEEKNLIYLSNHDPVTGLINRHLFEETLASEIQLASNNDQKLGLLLIDINNFRLLNATFGHAAGDIILRTIANELLSLQYAVDHTSRIENDQFAIIIHDAKSVALITEQIKKINNTLSRKIEVFNDSISILLNIGAAMFPDDGSNVIELIRSADVALSIATQRGPGIFQFSTPELTDNAWQKMSMENSIRDALSNNEFYLVYQPITDCKNMTTAGFEALLRWNRGGTSVPTQTFIPILEKTGLFTIIGEWILRTACQQCKNWQDQVSKSIYVSVNLSMIEFQNPDLIDLVKNILEEVGLDPGLLTIEITEATLMRDKEAAIRIANSIKNLGVKIAIDDFGSGYSSLNYITHVPTDYIKLDKAFIDEICLDQRVVSVVKATIELGSTLNYKTIAEGVETKEQLDLLASLSCQYIQGFYFSKPMSASDSMKFIMQQDMNVGE